MEITLLEQVLFWAVGAVAIAAAFIVVFNKNILYSGLAMLLFSVVLAFIYIWVGQEYFGAMQLLIYSGAVMVLFLFMIMLLNTRTDVDKIKFDFRFTLAISLFIILGVIFHNLKNITPSGENYNLANRPSFGSSLLFARELYFNHYYEIILLGVVALVGVVAAVVLAQQKQLKRS